MAGVWSMYRHRRKNGYRHFRYQKIFYIYILSYSWLSGNFLFIFCFLDEY